MTSIPAICAVSIISFVSQPVSQVCKQIFCPRIFIKSFAWLPSLIIGFCSETYRLASCVRCHMYLRIQPPLFILLYAPSPDCLPWLRLRALYKCCIYHQPFAHAQRGAGSCALIAPAARAVFSGPNPELNLANLAAACQYLENGIYKITYRGRGGLADKAQVFPIPYLRYHVFYKLVHYSYFTALLSWLNIFYYFTPSLYF